jgi:hypothetical protein
MNSGVIYNASAVVGAGLNNDLLLSGSITLNGDINMANFTLNNVRNVSKSDLNLSLIPATAGSPGQVLTRASNFDIKDPLTAQLVWTTPTGGVTNPLSGILDCNGFGLYNVSSITSQNSGSFNISINGSLLFIQNIPVLSSPNGLRIRVAEIFNTGLVTSFLDDCVFSKVVLFANGIETNTIKQRTGTALALTSPTINISGSTAINLTGPTNIIGNAIFQQTVRTNTLDTYTGGTVSSLQNLTLAATKRLNAPSVYTNNIRPYENSELVITGLQSDNKTLNFEKVHSENIQNHKIVFRELSWKEGLEIDATSLKQQNKNYYLSSEKEKREIIKKSLLEIYNDQGVKIDFTFEDLSFSFVEDFWIVYQKYLHLSSSEVNEIYTNSKKYFDSNNSEVFPLHPMIIEVDYMTKGIISLSKKEFEELSIREFEAIQLIFAVKNGG